MIRRIKIATGLVSAALLFLLMMLTVVDVVGRNFLHAPLPGAAELTEIALPLMVFLLLPQIALEQKHITVDLIDGISGPVLRLLQKVLAAVAGTTLFFLIAWQLWVLGDRSASYGDVSTTLHIPLAPVLYFVSVLSGVCVLAFLAVLFMPQKQHSSPEDMVEEARRSNV